MNHFKSYFSIVFILIGLSINPVSLFGQDTLQPTRFESFHIKRSCARDPQTLANKLTEGLTGEKEKFDAIFTWVVWNIRYDTRRYNSGKAYSSKLLAKKTLRKRRGVCTDYAHLMDTLCEVAGIQNISIGGYTKEVNFDLYDTLYFDNHAWNAVKLNGLWYVYDATWCAGIGSYEYTKLAKWRKKQIEHFWSKVRLEPRALMSKKSKKKRYCGQKDRETYKTVDVWVLPWFPRIMISILNIFPFRYKETYQAVANTKYYLANPEVFAVTHFPNDPGLSLTSRVNSVQQFSADSAYYDRTLLDSIDKGRSGRFCLSCDDYYFMDELAREKRIVSTSFVNNPENHLIPANYNLYYGQLLLEKTLKENDSLAKMILIDSTRTYMDSCKFHLRESRKANRAYYKFQTTKNKEKRKQLMTENKGHKAFIEGVFKQTNKRKLMVRRLMVKSNNYGKRGIRALNRFNEGVRANVSSKKMKEEQKQKMITDLSTFRLRSDSLTREITNIQNLFVVNTSNLWANVMQKQMVINPLVNDFAIDGDMRQFYLLDSYDKYVRDLRVRIIEREAVIDSTLQKDVWTLTDTVYSEFVYMNELLRQRNALNLKIVKLMMNLSGAGVIPKEAIFQFRDSTKAIMKEDVCTNEDNYDLLEATKLNFVYFLKMQKYFNRMISVDNRVEENRTRLVNKHISRNQKRVLSAVEGNTAIVTNVLKTLIVHKAKFLSKY